MFNENPSPTGKKLSKLDVTELGPRTLKQGDLWLTPNFNDKHVNLGNLLETAENRLGNRERHTYRQTVNDGTRCRYGYRYEAGIRRNAPVGDTEYEAEIVALLWRHGPIRGQGFHTLRKVFVKGEVLHEKHPPVYCDEWYEAVFTDP